MDEHESGPEGEEAAPPSPAWSPWSDLPPASRPRAHGALIAWVRDTLQAGWPEPAVPLQPCWPAHADAVADCRALKAKLDAAQAPPVKDGRIGAAPVGRWLDWAVDLERASDRWRTSFKRCSQDTCYRATPPDHVALEAAQAGVATPAAAQAAWGVVPVEPEAGPEPWEVAAVAAAVARQAQTATGPEEAEAGADAAPADLAESW